MGTSKEKSSTPIRRYAKVFTKPSRTQQHFKEECDINRIVRRYQETGFITHANPRQPTYGYASSQTFTEAMQTVALATEQFEALPAEVRKHFNNDPAQYLDAVADETRGEELASLGLINLPVPNPGDFEETPSQEPTEAPAIPDPAGSVLESDDR